MNKIVILTNTEDWEVLFVNGKYVNEYHQIQLEEIARYCPIESLSKEEMTSALMQEVYRSGSLPPDINTLEAARNYR